MSLSSLPDHILIRDTNDISDYMGETFYLSTRKGKALLSQIEKIDEQLESRQPHIEPEYDSNGKIIISEVMGYDDNGEEIWTSLPNQS